MLQTLLRPFFKPKVDIKDRPSLDRVWDLLRNRSTGKNQSRNEVSIDKGTASIEEKFNYLMVKLEFPTLYLGESDRKLKNWIPFYLSADETRWSRRCFEVVLSFDDSEWERQLEELLAAHKKYVRNGFYVPGLKTYEVEEIVSRSRGVSLRDKMISLYGFYFP